jgi:hypothetical protein
MSVTQQMGVFQQPASVRIMESCPHVKREVGADDHATDYTTCSLDPQCTDVRVAIFVTAGTVNVNGPFFPPEAFSALAIYPFKFITVIS